MSTDETLEPMEDAALALAQAFRHAQETGDTKGADELLTCLQGVEGLLLSRGVTLKQAVERSKARWKETHDVLTQIHESVMSTQTVLDRIIEQQKEAAAARSSPTVCALQ